MILFAAALLAAASPPQGDGAAPRRPAETAAHAAAEQAAVRAAVGQLLGRLTGKDPAQMAALTLADGGATAIGAGPDGKTTVRHFTWAEFFAHLPKDKPILDERLRDILVRVDGDVAMVWGRYDVTVDGKFFHCGTDHFDLVRVDGRWRILTVTWNQRTSGC
jgi:hypothetical protein